MGTSLDIFLASFGAMTHVFLVSFVGYIAAIVCPKRTPNTPLLPPEALRLFARMSIGVFAPALTLYSTSRRMDAELLSASAILAMWSLVQNVIGFNVAKLFRGFHEDARLGRCIEVAVGTPNQLSLPIMVLLAMCKSDLVNAEFGGDAEECSSVSVGRTNIYTNLELNQTGFAGGNVNAFCFRSWRASIFLEFRIRGSRWTKEWG